MPLTALIMQFEPPSDKHPCLLSFTETQALFSKVNYCLISRTDARGDFSARLIRLTFYSLDIIFSTY